MAAFASSPHDPSSLPPRETPSAMQDFLYSRITDGALLGKSDWEPFDRTIDVHISNLRRAGFARALNASRRFGSGYYLQQTVRKTR